MPSHSGCAAATSAYAASTSSTSAWPSASRPRARAIWRAWSCQDEKYWVEPSTLVTVGAIAESSS